MAPSSVAQQNGKGGAQDGSLAENGAGTALPVRTAGDVPSPSGPAPWVRPGALPCSPRCLPHSRHPGSPCGPAFAGRYSACGRCCRRGRYLEVRGTKSGGRAAGEGSSRHPVFHHQPQGGLAMGRAGYLLDGKPPPKNILKRSSGEMSASKPRWKSPCPWPCRAAWLLSSPNWSYCFLFSGLLSTAYAVPMARKEV